MQILLQITACYIPYDIFFTLLFQYKIYPSINKSNFLRRNISYFNKSGINHFYAGLYFKTWNYLHNEKEKVFQKFDPYRFKDIALIKIISLSLSGSFINALVMQNNQYYNLRLCRGLC
jgi:hypothetical protein